MSTEFAMSAFFLLVFSLIIAYEVFTKYDQDIGSENDPEEGRQKYLPYLPVGNILPLMLLVIGIFSIYWYGWKSGLQIMFTSFITVFIHISAYYVILILLLPLFRKWCNARVCAMLWMVPNFLYLMQMSYMEFRQPKYIITLTHGVIGWIFGIWFAGFIGVLAVKIIQHLVFRRQLLKNAVPVTDEEILTVWKKEVEFTGIRKPKFRLVVSDALHTPLSIGFFNRSVRVVLPHLDYTQKELELIFRHELVHISREDAQTKFFLVFCTAMCWFNPLMWFAMRKSADDIELGCDETVLLHADESTRRQYAELILNTAGDSRGFSTCLSANASSVRYRLRKIVKPGKMRGGALVVGAAFFLLCITSGTLAVAYDTVQGKDLFFGGDPETWNLIRISQYEDRHVNIYYSKDDPELKAFLSGLQLHTMTGNFSYDSDGEKIEILMECPDGIRRIDVSDHYLRVSPMEGERKAGVHYYTKEPVDFDALYSLLEIRPELYVYISDENGENGTELRASLISLIKTDGNTTEIIPVDHQAGTQVSFAGKKDNRDMLQLAFTGAYEEKYTVEIKSLADGTVKTISREELEQTGYILTHNIPAQYTVTADFTGEGDSVYQAVFCFEVLSAE